MSAYNWTKIWMNQDVAVVVNDESISTNTQLKSDSQLKFYQTTNFKDSPEMVASVS